MNEEQARRVARIVNNMNEEDMKSMGKSLKDAANEGDMDLGEMVAIQDDFTSAIGLMRSVEPKKIDVVCEQIISKSKLLGIAQGEDKLSDEVIEEETEIFKRACKEIQELHEEDQSD